ncbi:MAG: hypothetical protein QOD39_3988, partial [Mycobacterium sp.]|nr:hypothetical protein [Mycobacterium sp.]
MSRIRLRRLMALAGAAILGSTLLSAAPALSAIPLPHPLVAPMVDSIQVSANKVTVTWTDRSDNESSFWIFRRSAAGTLQFVGEAFSLEPLFTGRQQSYEDVAPTLSDQCYQVWSVGSDF